MGLGQTPQLEAHLGDRGLRPRTPQHPPPGAWELLRAGQASGVLAPSLPPSRLSPHAPRTPEHTSEADVKGADL